MKHTIEELKTRQAYPLDLKIALTRERVRGWVNEFGEDGVYISFSGGKDSTVLMDIIRNEMGLNIPAVFVDVPTQFPELKQFALSWENVEVIKPKISFIEVCEKYGFPLISKEISDSVFDARRYLTKIINMTTSVQTDRQTDRQTDNRRFLCVRRYDGNSAQTTSKNKSDISEFEDGDYP